MSHIHYKLDYTIEVYIVHKDKVLLRKHDKYGIWLSVGGHIEPGEDPIEAALREVKEEVGLEVEIVTPIELLETDGERYQHLPPPAFMNRHRIVHEHEHLALIYFAETTQASITQSEQEKSEKCQWFTRKEIEDLQQNISSTVKNYAIAALAFLNPQ